MHILEWLSTVLTTSGLVVAYLIIFLIVFAESGVLIGFFLPGDSLLITLGLLASQGYFNLGILLVLMSVAAITGDSVGYWFGRKVGPGLFNREDTRIFKKENLRRAHQFYENYGTKTIVLARFVPFARTFAPILAGIGNMNYRLFLSYNIIGGITWVFSITLLGYFLGRVIPDVDRYVLLVVAGVIVASAIPAYMEYRRSKRHHSTPPSAP
jgi:membrane-associated protein